MICSKCRTNWVQYSCTDKCEDCLLANDSQHGAPGFMSGAAASRYGAPLDSSGARSGTRRGGRVPGDAIHLVEVITGSTQ